MPLIPLRGQAKALLWKGLDKFGSVHDRMKSPVGHFMHDSCLALPKEAQKRQKKRDVDQCQSQSSSILRLVPKTSQEAAIKFEADS